MRNWLPFFPFACPSMCLAVGVELLSSCDALTACACFCFRVWQLLSWWDLALRLHDPFSDREARVLSKPSRVRNRADSCGFAFSIILSVAAKMTSGLPRAHVNSHAAHTRFRATHRLRIFRAKRGQRPHGCDQLACKCECCHGEAVVCFVC